MSESDRSTTETRTGRPPGPDGLAVLGETLSFLRGGLDWGTEIRDEYGDVVSFDALGREFVAVYHPELVDAVLVVRNDEFRKGEFESAAGDVIAPGGSSSLRGRRGGATDGCSSPRSHPTASGRSPT